ncbi:hypothetical protein QZH41_011284 [Actinostola sp. cb2023]|nr:hypothetical protein QZH41_011284 [Actinostola sp. cb2023]
MPEGDKGEKSKPRNKDANAANQKDSILDPSSLGKRLVINISGQRFETYDKTLDRFPDSLLGSRQRREKFYDHEKKEYFFDANRICFESILAYYQTCGVLIRPPNIPRKVFVSDIKYFDLGEQALQQAGDDLDTAFTPEDRPMPENIIQRKIWSIFEYPDTSNIARVMALFSVSVIIISIVLFCVETLPQFQPKAETKTTRNITSEEPIPKHRPNFAFFIIEAMCITWFTFEYLIRFLCSPNKWKFVVSVLNIIDVVAIIPFYITLPMKEPTSVSSLAILRCVRLVRVFRIFKLSRYSRGLQILGHTLKASLRELGLLFFFLCVGVILFSSAVYYAEFGTSPTEFKSIPHAFWWSIITMTTVGYGDMVPQTLGGKLVGCFCAITGVLAIALPVPVIVSNFAYYYSREHNRGQNGGNDDEEEEEKTKDVESASPSKITCCGKSLPILPKKTEKNRKKDNNAQTSKSDVEEGIELDAKNGNVWIKNIDNNRPIGDPENISNADEPKSAKDATCSDKQSTEATVSKILQHENPKREGSEKYADETKI